MKYGFVKVAAAVPFVRVADCAYNVSHPYKGDGSCYLDKSILHIIPFLVLNHL